MTVIVDCNIQGDQADFGRAGICIGAVGSCDMFYPSLAIILNCITNLLVFART